MSDSEDSFYVVILPPVIQIIPSYLPTQNTCCKNYCQEFYAQKGHLILSLILWAVAIVILVWAIRQLIEDLNRH